MCNSGAGHPAIRIHLQQCCYTSFWCYFMGIVASAFDGPLLSSLTWPFPFFLDLQDCVRKTITRLEAKLNIPRVLGHVAYMLRSKDRSVAQATAMALARLAPNKELKHIFLDKQALDIMLKMLTDVTTEPQMQREAAQCLLKLVEKVNASTPSQAPVEESCALYLGDRYITNKQTLTGEGEKGCQGGCEVARSGSLFMKVLVCWDVEEAGQLCFDWRKATRAVCRFVDCCIGRSVHFCSAWHSCGGLCLCAKPCTTAVARECSFLCCFEDYASWSDVGTCTLCSGHGLQHASLLALQTSPSWWRAGRSMPTGLPCWPAARPSGPCSTRASGRKMQLVSASPTCHGQCLRWVSRFTSGLAHAWPGSSMSLRLWTLWMVCML